MMGADSGEMGGVAENRPPRPRHTRAPSAPVVNYSPLSDPANLQSAAAIAKPKRRAPPRPSGATLRGRPLHSHSLPLPTDRSQQDARPGASRTETRPGASCAEPRTHLHHQRSATLDFWEPGKHETHRLKTSATSPTPLADVDLRTSSASSSGSQGTRRAAGSKADGAQDPVWAGSGAQAPGRAGPSEASSAKPDLRPARPVARAASMGTLPGSSSTVRADLRLASARLKKQSSHKGGNRPAGDAGEASSEARRAASAAATGLSAGEAGEGVPAGEAGEAAAIPRAASAPSDAPEQAPEVGPSGSQQDPASGDAEGVGSYKEPSSSEPGSGEAETAGSPNDADGSDTASQADAGAQELTPSVRSVSLPSPPPIPMRWSEHVVSSGMPAAKATAICKIVEREVEWHFQRFQPEQGLTALTQYRLASSIEERLQDERMLVSVYSPQCPPHATVSRGQAQTFYGIFGSRLLDWQAQKRWLQLQKEELAQSPHAASQPGFGTAQEAEAAVHIRKHVPKPDLLRAVVDITIFA